MNRCEKCDVSRKWSEYGGFWYHTDTQLSACTGVWAESHTGPDIQIPEETR